MANLNRKDLLINKTSKNHATLLEKTLVNNIINYKGYISVKITAMFFLLTAQRSFSIRKILIWIMAFDIYRKKI